MCVTVSGDINSLHLTESNLGRQCLSYRSPYVTLLKSYPASYQLEEEVPVSDYDYRHKVKSLSQVCSIIGVGEKGKVRHSKSIPLLAGPFLSLWNGKRAGGCLALCVAPCNSNPHKVLHTCTDDNRLCRSAASPTMY